MLKKIIVSGIFLALVAILVAGAINRTLDKSERAADGAAERSGRSNEAVRSNAEASQGQRQASTANGGRQGQVNQERGYPNYQEAPAEWLLYEGTVSQVPAGGLDLILATAAGEMVVGTGPLDLGEQGFVLQAGELLQVRGYWEGAEFKAGELTLVESNISVTLRDQMGRPSWSGANGTGRGGDANNIGNEPAGAGQAEIGEWISLNGIAISVDDSSLVAKLGDGQVVGVENRPWWFAREQGFAAIVGDEIGLTGFYEGDTFEVGRINNLSLETMVQIREESGRPLWAGGAGGRGAQIIG